MNRMIIALTALVFFSLSVAAPAADLKHYPGAKIDARATKEATEASRQAKVRSTATIYTTNDPFEKVYAFYKGSGKEFRMPGHGTPQKLPSGQDLKEAYFILDGAADFSKSKHWMKIQRPAIGLYMEDLKQGTIRDLTVIIVSEQK